LDWDALGDVDYLYVSHLHRDHFDPKNLREHVNKDAVVLLPDFPVPDLQRELEKVASTILRDDGLRQAPRQRAQGRSRCDDHRAARPGRWADRRLRSVVDDGETVCFNMNDARPVDLDVLHADFGPVDVHMLQYSGAIWYPMVYDMPARAKEAFGTQKRQRQMDRCRQYIAQVGATWVVPSAGPPCFLDPELRDLNDDHGDPANIFPDQAVFLDQMRTHGHDRGLLMIPGSTADFHWITVELIDPSVARGRSSGHLHDRADFEVFEQPFRIHPVLQYNDMVQVVAAILEREGLILIGTRKPEQSHPLQWEFPGGKVEPGESPQEAVTRELEEELSIRARDLSEITRYQFTYPARLLSS